eukprot:TRINITY_DN5721_c0_g1_i1.p1 TRINITY_DN5721_c0_g1~~TRINITY_DN5721_c0_g1_i1.p1  ORF type:complete len:1292 (+),score=481.97 TRINITY_DN5721_c0_g1_i1:74-3949(+)
MTSSFGATNVVVAVRTRPLTPQEEEKGEDKLTLTMDQSQKTTTLIEPGTGNKKKFRFDYNYWSVGDPNAPGYASQEKIFNDLAEAQLKHALGGYNACIFAYGQTSSGKTYTMMGPPHHTDHSKFNSQTGLIPRMCDSLFQHISSADTANTNYRVEMSFYEIYNEKVYCLLDPSTNGTLRPREDPKAGPYVENLQAIQVTHYQHIAELLKIGNKTRHTSKTKMNDRSSRSHAVFCLTITKSEWVKDSGDAMEFISRVNLVDLAGSERTAKAGTEGDTLKEGININKSLTSLGMVIKKLADLNDPTVQTDGSYVPYRDSTLTWLLKDNLGGNSRTVMLATLSPCKYNYDETHTTLRYAERVKLIKNVPSVNRRGSNRKIIRDLRREVRQLHEQLYSMKAPLGGLPSDITHRSTPVGLWATTPFMQTTAKYGEPFLWFIRQGFTLVSGVRSYAALQGEEEKSVGSGSVTPRKVGRKSSGGLRRPSYLQPTLASAFKDNETSAQLKGTELLGKDLAHTVMNQGQDDGKPRRMRSVDMGGRRSSRKRSSSGGVGKRNSVAKALETANAKINVEIQNVKVVDDSEGEDDDGNNTPVIPTLDIPLVKNRHSSILGVGFGVGSSVPTTPRDEEVADTLESLFEDPSGAWPPTRDLLSAQSPPNVIKLANLAPTPNDSPYAVFRYLPNGKILLLPLGQVSLNSTPLTPNTPIPLPPKCELRFGAHPPFIYVNPSFVASFQEGGAEGAFADNDLLEEASMELLKDKAYENMMFGINGPTPAEAMLQKRLRELESENSLLMSERGNTDNSPLSSPNHGNGLPTITLTPSGAWVVTGTLPPDAPPLTLANATSLLQQLSSRSMTGTTSSMGLGKQESNLSTAIPDESVDELKVITATEYHTLKRDVVVERARAETAKRDLILTHEREKLEIAKELEMTKQRLAALEFQNARHTEKANETATLESEKDQLRSQIDDLNRSIIDNELNRRDLELCLRKLEAAKEEERRLYESKLDSEEYRAQQKQIESEVNDKYRQLDILKAQIGDKKHAAKQLQDSYQERLTDLEREAWEKHRAIKELQVEEQDGMSRVQQLRQEEERLADKLNKHRRAKEEVMYAKELNAIEMYDFIGGLRLDDAMFRNKKIQLSRQSRTPICLRFTPTGLLVFNADALKTGAVRQARGPNRTLSPAGRAITCGTVLGAAEPLREINYDKIQKVKLIDGCVIQITAAGQTTDLGILCDNKLKRNAIQKIIMLKTRGVILALPQSYTTQHDAAEVSEEEMNSPLSGNLSPSGIPPISLNSAIRR